MTAVVIDIRKRKYVCGLFWQSLSQPRELKAEAIDLARKLNFDLLVLRKDLGVAQAGFASSREGAQKHMLSLGAIVASTVAVKGVHHDGRQQPATSWLGAFRLDEKRWAYFAVRDESFLPSGDFAGTRAEVLERLYADYGLGGWNAVIGEAELEDQGFHNFNVASIDDFLPNSSGRRLWLASAWELSSVERSRRTMLAIGGVGAVAVAAGATALWLRHRDAEQTAARAQATQSVQQRLAAERVKSTPSRPWPGQPSPREFARACAGGLDLIAPGGWRLDEALCSGAMLSYAWSRGDSNVSYLLEHVPQARVDLAGEKARYARTLSLQPGPSEELIAADDLLGPLVSRFQELGLRLTVKAPPAPQPSALPGLQQLVPPPPDWKAYAFSLETGGVPLMDLASALSQPGVRVNRMTYRHGDWFVEGVAYAK